MNNRHNILLFITVSLFVALAGGSSAGADQTTVDEIVSKANRAAFYQGADGRAQVKMTITDNQARERIREFVILRLNVEEGGAQKYYVFFEKPDDVANMVYMVWKYTDKDDDRWLYLPALDLVRRVASGDKRASFVGSHFLYEDVSGRGIGEDVHELIEETDEYYKLKNTPKDPDSVEFAYYELWIDKKTYMPTRAEYHDEQGSLYRVVEALEIQEIQGLPTVIRSKASDLTGGGSTVTEFSNVEYNIGLTDDIFTERYLRRPPVRWIRR
ncbi:MAG: outer membrane lipoprotein-sorting protein [Candidatus Omnitrophica bacterium]|nr:outer membrane lipoprotein-sorting protein [Candidatus Omnitrophota bacterium]